MAEGGGTRIGTMIAEIDLDARRYDAGLRQALTSAQTTTQSAEQAWRRLGTGSTETIDRMRANAVRSYETIRNSATSTAADIERAERATMARLEQINRRYYGSTVSQIQQVEAAAASMGNSMARSFASMATAAAAAVLSIGSIVNEIQNIAQAGMRMESTLNAFTSIYGNATLAANEMAFVSTEAERLGLNLVTLEQSYKSLSAGAQGTALAGEGVRKIFSAVSQASAVMGLSAEQTEGALRALEQMISKGNVQAEELRGQLSERLPGAFGMAAKAMGVTTAELNEMLEAGEVMAVDLLPKLADELQNRFGSAAEAAGETGRASFARFQNAIENLERALAQSGILDMLGSIANVAANIMNTVSKIINPSTGVARMSELQVQIAALRKEQALAIVEAEKIAKLQADRGISGGFYGSSSVSDNALKTNNEKLETLEKELGILQQIAVQGDIQKAKGQEREYQEKKVADQLSLQADILESGINYSLEQAFNLDSTKTEKSAKAATAAIQKAANEQKRIAEQAAKEHLQIIEKFQDDYNKSILSSADYQQLQLDEEMRQYQQHVQDKSALDAWYSSESKKIEEQRLNDSEKALKDYFSEIDDLDKDLTDTAREEADQRAQDFKDALEDQRRAYEDFVSDVQSATSDIFMSLFDGGFSSFFDEIEDRFKRLLADMAAQAIAEPIIVPVVQAIGGTLGTSAANSLGIPTAGTSGTGFSLSNLSSVYSAISGGLETGVYNALTGGILNSVGSGLFGATAWSGAAGAELGWGATAAATTGMGTAGIAGAIAAAAPWAAMVALAVPLVMRLFEDDPEPFLRVQTTSTSQELSDPNYQWANGEGVSPAGFDYNLTLQDIDSSESREALYKAITGMLDAQFIAIEDTLNVSVNDAIVAAQNAGSGYGDGFFSKIDLAGYEDDLEGALTALSEDLFQDIRDELTIQLTGAQGTLFNDGFFDAIAVEGETAVATFLRFGQVVESTDNFMAEFTRQTDVYGESAYQAFQNITTITAVMDQLSIASKSFTDNSAISTLEEIDAAYQVLVETLKDANATVEDLAAAEQYRLQELGAAITGLTATSVATALWNAIQNGQDAEAFVSSLENQIREGVAQTLVNSLSEGIYSAFISPINSAIASMVSQIQFGGMTTGAALSASMSVIKDSLDTAIALMKNEEFKALINNFITESSTLLPASGGSYVVDTQPTPYDTDTSYADLEAAREEAAQKEKERIEALADMMAEVKDSISDSGLDEYALKLAQINRATDASIVQAAALGAAESDLAMIREWGAIQIDQVMDDQAAKLADMMDKTRIAISDAGLSDYVQEITEISRKMEENISIASDLGATEQELAEIRSLAAIETQAVIDESYNSVVGLAEIQEKIRGVSSIVDDQVLYYQIASLFDIDYSEIAQFSKQELIDAFMSTSALEWGTILEQAGINTDEFASLMASLVSSLEADSARLESLLELHARITGQTSGYIDKYRRESLSDLFDWDFSALSDSQIVESFEALSEIDMQKIADMLGSDTTEFVQILSDMVADIATQKEDLANINDYISQYTDSDLLSATKSSYQSSIDNYTDKIDALSDSIYDTYPAPSSPEGESALRDQSQIEARAILIAASINEALTPIVTSFESLFTSVQNMTQSASEIELSEFNSQITQISDSIGYLATQGVFELEELEGFVAGFEAIVEQLQSAKISSILKDQIESLADAQAGILGLQDEYLLARLSVKYGRDFTDMSVRVSALDAFTSATIEDITAQATTLGIPIDDIISDFSDLGSTIEDISSTFDDLQETLEDYIGSLLQSDYNSLSSPSVKTASAKSALQTAAESAMSSDIETAQAAMAQLPDLAEAFLDASKDSTTSVYGYNDALAYVLSTISKAEAQASSLITDSAGSDAEGVAMLEYQAQQVQDLTDQIDDIFSDATLTDFFSKFKSIFSDSVTDSLSVAATSSLEDLMALIGDGQIELAISIAGDPTFDASGITLDTLVTSIESMLEQSVSIDLSTDFIIELIGNPTFDASGITLSDLTSFVSDMLDIPDMTIESAAEITIALINTPTFDASGITLYDLSLSISDMLEIPDMTIESAVDIAIALTSNPTFELTGLSTSDITGFVSDLIEIPDMTVESAAEITISMLKAPGFEFGGDTFASLFEGLGFTRDIYDLGDEYQAAFEALSQQVLTGQGSIADLQAFINENGLWRYGTELQVALVLNTDAFDDATIESQLEMLNQSIMEFGLTPVTFAIVGQLAGHDVDWSDVSAAFTAAGYTPEQLNANLVLSFGYGEGESFVPLVNGDALNSYMDTHLGMDAITRNAILYLTLGAADSDLGYVSWTDIGDELENLIPDGLTRTITLETIYDNSQSSAFVSWESFMEAIGHQFEAGDVAGISRALELTTVYNDGGGTGTLGTFNSWVDSIRQYDSLDETARDLIEKTISVSFINNGLTADQAADIMSAWGVSEDLTASIIATINGEVTLADSDKLLTELTFGTFAAAFLGASNEWSSGGGSLLVPASSGTMEGKDLFSIIDGIIFLWGTMQNPNSITNSYLSTANSYLNTINTNMAAIANGLEGSVDATGRSLKKIAADGLQTSVINWADMDAIIKSSYMPIDFVAMGSLMADVIPTPVVNVSVDVVNTLPINNISQSSDNSAIVAELKAVKEDLKKANEYNYQLLKVSLKQYDLADRQANEA